MILSNHYTNLSSLPINPLSKPVSRSISLVIHFLTYENNRYSKSKILQLRPVKPVPNAIGKVKKSEKTAYYVMF